jgi:P63C domain
MDEEHKPTAVERGAMGGEARAAKLPTEQRKEIARNAANARWGADMPQASHDGPLQIGDALLIAAVLPNGKRLLSQGTMLQAIGRSRTPKAGTGGFSTVDALPFFLQAETLKPFISEELMTSTTPILFRLRSGQRTVGYDAILLPMVCEVYLKLRDACLSKEKAGDRKVPKQYEKSVRACDLLMRGLARRGIIALVDDATGYRGDQIKEDVLRVIAEYMSPRLVTLTKRFNPEFFEEVYRIHGWEYKRGNIHHPQCTGHFIVRHIYEPLPPGVLEEMKVRLPKNEHGNRKSQLWRTLSVDTGIPHLDRQINDVLLLMQISADKKEFSILFERRFGKQLQLRLQLLKEFKELTA